MEYFGSGIYPGTSCIEDITIELIDGGNSGNILQYSSGTYSSRIGYIPDRSCQSSPSAGLGQSKKLSEPPSYPVRRCFRIIAEGIHKSRTALLYVLTVNACTLERYCCGQLLCCRNSKGTPPRSLLRIEFRKEVEDEVHRWQHASADSRKFSIVLHDSGR